MSSPTPPTVLLDRSFVGAVARPDHADHERVAACYRQLLDRYAAGTVRLRAHTDALPSPRPDLFAPVERIPVAGQHRRAAARLHLPVPVTPEVALTLVVMRREGIRRIATLDPAFGAFDVEMELLPLS